MNKTASEDLALSPIQVAAIMASLVVLFAILSPPQQTAANVIILFGGLLAFIHPRNGLFFTLLSAPFFLGEPQDPFVYIINYLAGITIAAWVIHFLLARRRPHIPCLGWLIFLAGLILADLPLNFKEIVATLNHLGLGQVSHLLVEGYKFHDLYALRAIILSLGGLAFLACCLDLLRAEDFRPLGLALVLIGILLAAASLALWLNILPRGQFYLGLNLIGVASRHGQNQLATTAFNPQYFNEFMILVWAILGAAIVWSRRLPARLVSLVVLIGLVLIVVLTSQRAPLVCLVVMALAAWGLAVWLNGRRGMRVGLWSLAGVAALIALVLLFDATLGQDLLVDRFLAAVSGLTFAASELRVQLWRVVESFVRHYPLTGTGPGTFLMLSPELARLGGQPWTLELARVAGTAHNTYLQWAAELGLIFLAAALILGGRLTRSGLAALRDVSHRPEAGAILVALAGFACFGLFQHIFYLSSIAILILAGLAGLAVLRPPRSWKVGRLGLILGLAVIILVLVLKIVTITDRPLRPDFKAGVYPIERIKPDDHLAWWTSGRTAVFWLKPAPPRLRFFVALPHPVVTGRAQKVEVLVNGEQISQVLLKDYSWQSIDLDLSEMAGQEVKLEIKTGYAFSPFTYDGTPDMRRLGVLVRWAETG